MKLTAQKLEQIAKIADIRLDTDETMYYLGELNKVIELFEQIKEIEIEETKDAYCVQQENWIMEESRELKELFSEYLMMPTAVLE